MDVLLVGSGAREHALAWKIKQSPRIGKLYIAPGNGGTRYIGENVPIGILEFNKLADFVEERNIGLTVCSMDDPLAQGIVDFFTNRNLRIWGPSKDAAQIESSKVFAKELMTEGKIPTALFKVCTSAAQALAYVRRSRLPLVIKASGLALGKGVYICRTFEEAEKAVDEIMVRRIFGESGAEVVIEEYLVGPEISIHALSDGLGHVLFPPSQDHKRALDNDEGPNTGGMGAIAPVPWMTVEHMTHIEHKVVAPALDVMRKRGIWYRGMLYPGLIMTLNGPKVLEYNARFGDPECQAYMRLLKSDLLDLFDACIDSTISETKKSIEWHLGFAVNIVITSGGYPGEYKKGLPIEGIEAAEQVPTAVVFHAGTTQSGGQLVTSGGRVLSVSATGPTLKAALDRAYEAIGKIHFEGMYFRRDIGAKALSTK